MQAESSTAEPSAPIFSLAKILNGDENLEHPDVQEAEDDELIQNGHAASGFCVECEGSLCYHCGRKAHKFRRFTRPTRSASM